ncbi:MAG: alpha/beta hydrolase-fold protein [Acholeplasma sp.]|nr:alpha/beta hydrolase-fold protein [Acholeplasma sp.]
MTIIRKTIHLESLNRNAICSVMLPKAYDKDYKYPVLLMQDGQNLFDDKEASFGVSWGLETIFDHTEMPDIIVVGISCANGLNRLDEYNPFISNPFMLDGQKRITGGKGDLYIHDLIDIVIPLLNKSYCINLNDVSIAGSSMGGLISLYAALRYPKIFKHAIGLSNAFWIAEKELIDFIEKVKSKPKGMIYLDTGDSEDKDDFTYLESNRKVYNALVQKGVSVVYKEIKEGIHHESSWRTRIKDIIKLIYA